MCLTTKFSGAELFSAAVSQSKICSILGRLFGTSFQHLVISSAMNRGVPSGGGIL